MSPCGVRGVAAPTAVDFSQLFVLLLLPISFPSGTLPIRLARQLPPEPFTSSDPSTTVTFKEAMLSDSRQSDRRQLNQDVNLLIFLLVFYSPFQLLHSPAMHTLPL